LDKEFPPIDAKYTRYSTEQLEVILAHLSDPDERESVKRELGQRYYRHYLSIIKKPGEQARTDASAAPRAASPPADDSEENNLSEDQPDQTAAELLPDEEIAQPVDAPPTDDDLVDLAAVAPISLPPPATPRAEETDAGKIGEEVSAQETKRKFCFIATAAYGSPMAREVLLLKTFRDDHLAPRFCGRKFIQGYYRVSPFLARPIGRSNLLKLLTRWLLTPIVCFIKKNFGGPGRS
jgi:hypothetical protein